MRKTLTECDSAYLSSQHIESYLKEKKMKEENRRRKKGKEEEKEQGMGRGGRSRRE